MNSTKLMKNQKLKVLPMLNHEPVEISISLSSSFWKTAPKTKVFIDETLIFDGTVSEIKTINWSGDLIEGKHKIVIELYDKDKYQTVMEDNVIVKDQLLNIDTITFDDIDIGYLKHSLSKYYPDKNHYTDNSVPEIINDCVNLGYNGKWEIEFNTPIYIWLLENI